MNFHRFNFVSTFVSLAISPNQLPPTASNIPLSYQNPSNYSFSTQRTPISYKPQSANLNLASSGSVNMKKNEFQNTVHDFQNNLNPNQSDYSNSNLQNANHNFQNPNPQTSTFSNTHHANTYLPNTYLPNTSCLSSSTESSSFTNFPYPPTRINTTASNGLSRTNTHTSSSEVSISSDDLRRPRKIFKRSKQRKEQMRVRAKLHRDKQKKDCEQVQSQKLHEHTVGDEIENLISIVQVRIGKTRRYLNEECEAQKIW